MYRYRLCLASTLNLLVSSSPLWKYRNGNDAAELYQKETEVSDDIQVSERLTTWPR